MIVKTWCGTLEWRTTVPQHPQKCSIASEIDSHCSSTANPAALKAASLLPASGQVQFLPANIGHGLPGK